MADAVAERNAALFERAQALDGLSERLRKVLDHIPIGIILLNESSRRDVQPSGTNAVANPGWEARFLSFGP